VSPGRQCWRSKGDLVNIDQTLADGTEVQIMLESRTGPGRELTRERVRLC